MAKQTIGVGSSADDGNGDTLRAAFQKCNSNFTELYDSSVDSFSVQPYRPRRNMVIAMVGDSNTNGRPGWQSAVNAEWLSEGGIFEGATVYNNGANGSQLAGWVNNITTAASDPRDPENSDTANPWDVVEGDPSLVIISLMTNDLHSPSARSTIGTEANLRANFSTLINFFLDNTQAIIWLRMPQPFTWGEGGDAFDYLTQWDNDDDCAASSALMRSLYLEWQNTNPRVFVYDSHLHLFGLRCDDKSTDCLDPDTNAAMIYDGLHPNDLGYRRIAQQMAQQWSGVDPKFRVRTIPDTIRENARWSANFYAREVDPANNLMSIDLTPELAICDDYDVSLARHNALFNTQNSPLSRSKIEQIALVQRIVPPGQYRDLLGCSGVVYLHFWLTGNTYTFTKPSLSQLVTATEPHYATIQLTGINSTLQSDDVGPCIFWVESDGSRPYEGLRRHADMVASLPNGQSSVVFRQAVDSTLANTDQITFAYLARNGGNAVTYELRARNQPDGRYVTHETFNTGKPIIEFVVAAGFWFPFRVIYRTDLWPSGFIVPSAAFLSLDVKSGTNNANCTVTCGRRRANPYPVVSVQPTNQSAADGADATFAVTASGVIAYQWQVSTDSGTTWADISGATNASYIRTVATGDNGYYFRCLMRFVDYDFTVTDTAILTVT